METLRIKTVPNISYQLTPLSMVKPNKDGIYAPSRFRKPKRLSWFEFMRNYTDTQVLVSFAPDGVSNPELMTAYGSGFDCWYLVDFGIE